LTFYVDAIGSTGIDGYEAGANRNMTVLNGSASLDWILPGHWREYFLRPPRDQESPYGTFEFFGQFSDGITGELMGFTCQDVTVPPFYDMSLANQTALAWQGAAGNTFNCTLNVTN
jgi:hypothetical protein